MNGFLHQSKLIPGRSCLLDQLEGIDVAGEEKYFARRNVATDGNRQIDSGHFGHEDIRDHEVGRPPLSCSERGCGVGKLYSFKKFNFKASCKNLGVPRLSSAQK